MYHWQSNPKKELWHNWFAWYPVKLDIGIWVIFTSVRRRLVWHWSVLYMNQGYYTKEYKLEAL